MRVRLEEVCERGSSNLMQKDITGCSGDYPIYGAAGQIGVIDFYHQENAYVAVVKDGAGIGRTMLLPAKSSVIGTMQYLIPKKNILPAYLYYVVRYMHLEKYFSGATIPHIYFKDYKNEEFNLETLEEQTKIVEILDKVSYAIDCRKQQLSELDTLTKARFVEMFGDVESNQFGWKKEPLKSHIDMLTGYPFDSSGYAESGIKICGGLIILPDKIKWDECKYWPNQKGYEQFLLAENDIVVALDRPWITDGFKIGMITADDLPALLIQRTARIRAKDMVQAFVLYLLKDKSFERQCTVTGSLVPHISNKDINNYQVIVPPLELQNQFAAFVAQVDKSGAHQYKRYWNHKL